MISLRGIRTENNYYHQIGVTIKPHSVGSFQIRCTNIRSLMRFPEGKKVEKIRVFRKLPFYNEIYTIVLS